jgi:hypothetical protein
VIEVNGFIRACLLATVVAVASPAPAQTSSGEVAAGESVAPPAQRFVDLWGPAVGSELPVLDAVDHSGERRRLADLAGQRGLLLFLVRSADW